MEFLLLVVVFPLVVTSAIIWGLYLLSKSLQKKKRKFWDENNIEYEVKLLHIGGNPYLSNNETCFIKINKDGSFNFMDKSKNILNTIQINQISNCQIKNETEMQNDVTLTRLALIGPLAFMAPKQTTVHNYYLIISYIQNDVKLDCVFKNTPYDQNNFGEVLSSINRLKLRSNANS